MITFCEFYSRVVLPVIRALVARELVERYSMSQMEVANILGITQASVNYYLHGKRRKKLIDFVKNIPEVRETVVELSRLLKEGRIESVGPLLCNLCSRIRSNDEYIRKLLKITGSRRSRLLVVGINGRSS